MPDEMSPSGKLVPGRWGVDRCAPQAGCEDDGPASQDAHHGVTVFRPSVDELNELYEIRVTLEPIVTEIAARQPSTGDLARLERIVALMRDAEPMRFVELNGEFHDRIYPAARRSRLAAITGRLREPAGVYLRMNLGLHDQAYRDEAQPEHEAILGPSRSRAASWAAHAMRVHLEHSARHIAAPIERARLQAPGAIERYLWRCRGLRRPDRSVRLRLWRGKDGPEDLLQRCGGIEHHVRGAPGHVIIGPNENGASGSDAALL